MTTITFDTHEFVTELKKAGFSEQQAEVITKLQKTAISSTLEQTRLEYDLDGIVTNQALDARLKELELKLAMQIAETHMKIAETNALVEKTKSDLSRLYVSLVLLQTTLITGILLKVAHLI